MPKNEAIRNSAEVSGWIPGVAQDLFRDEGYRPASSRLIENECDTACKDWRIRK